MSPAQSRRVSSRQLVDSLSQAVPQWAGRALGLGTSIELADGYRRIYLYHIRKTGGTSISTAIMALGGEEPAEVERRLERVRPHVTRSGRVVIAAHDRFAIATGGFTYAWSHMPAWKIHLRPGTFTVTVLRDPVERVISLYRYLSDPESDRGYAFVAPRADRALAAGSFSAFLDAIPRPDLLNQLFMFSSGFDPQEAAAAISGCSLFVMLPDLGHAMSRLSQLIGAPLSESRQRRSSPSGYQPNESELARLRDMLDPEYQLIGLLEPVRREQAGQAPSASVPDAVNRSRPAREVARRHG